jgi:thiol-disulfide isomerase/thioredoxin
VGGRTLARNVALMAVAAGVLAAELAAPAPDPGHATLHASTTAVLVGIIALAVVALAAAGRLALALMRAYGRMLLRVDALERRLADLGLDEVDEPLPELGLRPGTVAPLASAARIDGRPFVPEPGKPLLMLFTSPHCGPCNELLADVAGWQEAHRDRLSIVVAVDAPVPGAADVARRYDLETVIVDRGRRWPTLSMRAARRAQCSWTATATWEAGSPPGRIRSESSCARQCARRRCPWASRSRTLRSRHSTARRSRCQTWADARACSSSGTPGAASAGRCTRSCGYGRPASTAAAQDW